MNVEVEYEPPARADLIRLLTPRVTSDLDAVLFAGVYLEDLTRLFVSHQGDMPDAINLRRADGSRWWWRYVRGLWVAYVLTDQRSWAFGATTRTVRVLGFSAVPPRP